ncbi:MAG: alpha/beta hydrolase, partial [Erysipelotrichaceae bacterium]
MINYEIKGSGKTIVLLHGWGSNLTLMHNIAYYFKDTFQVINIDLPGFGKSDIITSMSIDDYVTCICNIIEKYHTSNPIIIAHSFGARVAIKYAAINKCSALILTGAAGIRPTRYPNYYIKVYLYKLTKLLNIKTNLGSKDYIEANPLLQQTLVKAVNEDLTYLLPHIDCPTLLIWGEDDKQTPIKYANKMNKLIKDSTLIIFENDDHFAYYHQPLRFNKVVEAYLKGV